MLKEEAITRGKADNDTYLCFHSSLCIRDGVFLYLIPAVA